MSNNIYGAIALTGGTSGSLDAIDGSSLNDNDAAIVFVSGDRFYIYILNSSSGLDESSPEIIAPDLNAGLKRWIRIDPYTAPVSTVLTTATGDILTGGGDILISGRD